MNMTIKEIQDILSHILSLKGKGKVEFGYAGMCVSAAVFGYCVYCVIQGNKEALILS